MASPRDAINSPAAWATNLTQGVPLPEAFGRQGLCQPTVPEFWAKLRYTAKRQRFAKRCSFSSHIPQITLKNNQLSLGKVVRCIRGIDISDPQNLDKAAGYRQC